MLDLGFLKVVAGRRGQGGDLPRGRAKGGPERLAGRLVRQSPWCWPRLLRWEGVRLLRLWFPSGQAWLHFGPRGLVWLLQLGALNVVDEGLMQWGHLVRGVVK